MPNLALLDLVLPYLMRGENLGAQHAAFSVLRVVSWETAVGDTAVTIRGRCEFNGYARIDPSSGGLAITAGVDEGAGAFDASRLTSVFDIRETAIEFELFVPRAPSAIIAAGESGITATGFAPARTVLTALSAGPVSDYPSSGFTLDLILEAPSIRPPFLHPARLNDQGVLSPDTSTREVSITLPKLRFRLSHGNPNPSQLRFELVSMGVSSLDDPGDFGVAELISMNPPYAYIGGASDHVVGIGFRSATLDLSSDWTPPALKDKAQVGDDWTGLYLPEVRLFVSPDGLRNFAFECGAQQLLIGLGQTADLGDPGNPAGPDVHAAGVRVGGQLAWDLALHAIKPAQPVLPLAPDALGWLVQTGGDNWDEPPPDTTGTIAAAMLETIPPFCDSPELALVPMPQPTDTIQSAVNSLATALGVTAPLITVANEDRLRRELQREIATAKQGQRDALWSLHRAIKQAREYVYLESPMFARTSRGGTRAADIDLVEVLRQRLHDNPRLKVIICVPRNPRSCAGQEDLRPRRSEAAQGSRRHPHHRSPNPGRGLPTDRVPGPAHPGPKHRGPGGPRLRARRHEPPAPPRDDVRRWCRRRQHRPRSQRPWVSSGVARFRQELMATRLGIAIPTGPANTSALWTRLAEPDSAFDVLADLLAGGGLGRCAPVWAGPTDTTVIPATDDNSDPNGVGDGPSLFALLSGLIPDA